MVKRMLFFVLVVLSFAYSEPDNVNELIKKYHYHPIGFQEN